MVEGKIYQDLLNRESKARKCYKEAIHRLQRCIVKASTKVGVQPVITQATKLSKKIKKSTS